MTDLFKEMARLMSDVSQEERRTAPMLESDKDYIERICKEELGQELHNLMQQVERPNNLDIGP